MIPEGGFNQYNSSHARNKTTYKSMKTQDLKETRQEEIERLDDTE